MPHATCLQPSSHRQAVVFQAAGAPRCGAPGHLPVVLLLQPASHLLIIQVGWGGGGLPVRALAPIRYITAKKGGGDQALVSQALFENTMSASTVLTVAIGSQCC